MVPNGCDGQGSFCIRVCLFNSSKASSGFSLLGFFDN